MATVRLLFLAALLVALVLAAPAPHTRSLKKRSFKVPRSINTMNKRGPNGFEAMRKVAMKYNLPVLKEGFISNERTKTIGAANAVNAAANGTNSTDDGSGEVAAVPEQNAALFLSPVDIGGQTLNLDFDSGSSDLWVFSTDLDQSAIGGHTAFDATKSANFKAVDGAQFSVSYGDGSGAAGTVGTDTVTIGGVSVDNQAVELANQVSQSFVQDTNTDGLVGLAFSKLNTVNDGQQSTPVKTFFDNVMNDLDLPVFTADLDPDGTGVYEFGSIDATKFEGAMNWVPVNASSGFWQFTSAQFAVGDQQFSNDAASPAIADTGTSLLLVDQAVAEQYYSAVQGAEENAQVGGFIYPCDAQLPDFAFQAGDAMQTVPGNVITFATVDQANTTCFGGIQGNSGAGIQIYGDIMFRSQLVAFNGGNQSLGFGQKGST